MFPGDNTQLSKNRRSTYLEEIIVYCRIIVFEQFLLVISDATPADWLEFQRDSDPFSPLFWFLVLQLPSLSDNTYPGLVGRYDGSTMVSKY